MMWPNQMTFWVRGFKIYFPFQPLNYGTTAVYGILALTNSRLLNYCRLNHVVDIIAIII